MNIDKRSLTKLYNINQELKGVFTEYTFLPRMYEIGICVSPKETCVLRTGWHVAFLKEEDMSLLLLRNSVIDSVKFYKYFSTYKKNITGLRTDNTITITTEPEMDTSLDIGYKLSETSPYVNDANNSSFVTTLDEMAVSFRPDVELSENDVISLVKNSYLVLKFGDFKTRITRELIPGLKKSYSVKVMFRDIPDERFYECIIECERSTIATYHIYRCLRFI